MTSAVDHTGSTILSPFSLISGQLPERRTVFLISSPTAGVRRVLAGADESAARPQMVNRPAWGLAVRPLHHIGASPVHAAGPRAGTRKWSGRSPRGRPPSAHPRGGWRRAGRCSQLLSDAKHPQHPQNGFWLGRNPLKKMSVGVAHKIPGSLYIILGHTLRSKCPGGASGGEPGSASKSAEGARYEY
jgi:hypothetical protein